MRHRDGAAQTCGGAAAGSAGVQRTLHYQSELDLFAEAVPEPPIDGPPRPGPDRDEGPPFDDIAEARADLTGERYPDRQRIKRPCAICGLEAAVWGPGLARCAEHFDFGHHQTPPAPDPMPHQRVLELFERARKAGRLRGP